MKRKFVVGIEDMTAVQEKAFGNYLNNNGYKWWHWISNFWILVSKDESVSAKDIYELVALGAPGNRCIVLGVKETYGFWGDGPNSANDRYFPWLKENWMEKEK